MMFKLTLTTLITLTPSLSAMSSYGSILNASFYQTSLRAAEVNMKVMAQNLANPGLVSAEWPAPRASYLRTPPLLDSPLSPVGNKVVLSQKHIDNILAIQATLSLDPERTGAEFTDFERGVGVALTQIAPNGMEGMVHVLGFVFSRERSHAILNAIIDAD